MAAEPVTAVEAYRHQHRWRLYTVLIVIAALIALALLAIIVGGVLLLRIARNEAPAYASIEEHFKYGSIGSEPTNGIPYWIWKTLPSLYPEEFGGRQDYAAFGLLYEPDEDGKQRDLPIGISRRNVSGVDVVWLNCATCHVGTWRETADAPRHIVPAMPSNNLDFHRFVRMVLRAAVDERLAPAKLFPAMEAAGADLGPIDRLIWRVGVLPRFREGLLQVHSGLQPLLEEQAAWGPGRVDTFNPYKVIQFDVPPEQLTPEERVGVADLPAVFNQHPREGMNLHWDGNNAVLQERNLSAAIGAGVTPDTVDHAAIERVADWLGDLRPPPSPHRPDPAAVARGAEVYAQACAACHGWQSDNGYVFEGELIGQVDPITSLGTDSSRLDSYTEWFRELQLEKLFAGTRYHFRHFKNTDGYANLPLDGLWLRGPYLHNGSVPTLADLLQPPGARPRAFLRGSDVVDSVNGGFQSPPCDPSQPQAGGFCFNTLERGNGAGGHLYGTDLPAGDKADLLAYLLTF
jgi:mono/diheme cytochrome c family protein